MAFTMSNAEASGLEQTFGTPSTTDTSIILTDEVDVELGTVDGKSLNKNRIETSVGYDGASTGLNENSEMTTTADRTKPTLQGISTVGDYENTTRENAASPSTTDSTEITSNSTEISSSSTEISPSNMNNITTVETITTGQENRNDTTVLPVVTTIQRQVATSGNPATTVNRRYETTISKKANEFSANNIKLVVPVIPSSTETGRYTTPVTFTTNTVMDTTQTHAVSENVFSKISSASTLAATTIIPMATGGTNEDKDSNILLIVGLVCVVVGIILGIIVAILVMTYCKKRRSRLKRRPTVPAKNPQEKTFERLDFSLSRTRSEAPDDTEEGSCYKRYDDPFPTSDVDEADAISHLSERPPIWSSTYDRRNNKFDYNRVSRASSSLYSTQDESSNHNFPRKLRSANRPSSCDTYRTDLADDSKDAGATSKKTVPPPKDKEENEADVTLTEDGGHVNTSFNDGKNVVIPPPQEFAETKSYDNEDEESHSGNSSVSYFDIQILPSTFQSPYKVSAVASGKDTPTHHCNSHDATDM